MPFVRLGRFASLANKNIATYILVYITVRRCLIKLLVDVRILRSDGKLFQTCIPLNVKDFLYMSVFALGKKSLHTFPSSFTLHWLNSIMNRTWDLSVYTSMHQLHPRHFSSPV